jgi:mannobiose 2-epimerase
MMLSAIILFNLCLLNAQMRITPPTDPAIFQQMRALLDQSVNLWYPKVLDRDYGGYYSNLDYAWRLDSSQDKMIVTQSRHIWSLAGCAEFYSDDKFANMAYHGYEFLSEKMWDHTYGGFYQLVDQQGTAILNHGDGIVKHAYGNAFAIYGLAALYRVSRDPQVLDLAIKAFHWLEKNSYDPEFKGYFEHMNREGTPFTDSFGHTPPKDQNSSIHLLEAFTELYHVWPDSLLRKRLEMMHDLVRNTMVSEDGYLRLFFRRDWEPVSFADAPLSEREANYHLDHISFGHDIETAYLLLEAAEALHISSPENLSRCKEMADYALRQGWDDEAGGLYDGGYLSLDEGHVDIIMKSKVWWAQAEALNTLHLLYLEYPDDPMEYDAKFNLLWKYITEYLLDKQYGGWYWAGVDNEPDRAEGHKAEIWKGNYHTFRTLFNCLNRH